MIRNPSGRENPKFRKLKHHWPLVVTLLSLLLLGYGRALALCAQSQCKPYQAWGWQKTGIFHCTGNWLDEKLTIQSDTCQFCGIIWCDNPDTKKICDESHTEFVYESLCHPEHCKLLCPERQGGDDQEAHCTKPLEEKSTKVKRHKCVAQAS